MFRHDKKKASSLKSKSLNDLTLLARPQSLLAEKKRHELVTQIKTSCALEATRFDSLCLSLLTNVASYCQSLPDSADYYMGGILDFVLNRTEAALHLFREFMAQDSQGEPSEEQKLWIYTLFSAALLQGLGKLHLEYHVNIYDDNGYFVKRWQPLIESPLEVGSLYHFEFDHPTQDDALLHRINVLQAHQLMPVAGYRWIVSNLDALTVWLALLHEDIDGAGTLGAILDRAKALTIQRNLLETPFRRNVAAAGTGRPRTLPMGTFIDTTPNTEGVATKERLVGIEFIRWLTEAIASGKIIINKAPLFVTVPGGMLMSLKLFEMFIEAHPSYKNWQSVQQGFLSLGLHHPHTDGNVISRLEHAQSNQYLTGIVVDHAVLPNQVHVLNHHTQQVSTMSAIELVNLSNLGALNQQQIGNQESSLLHLNESGQWRPMEKTTQPRQGLTHRV